MAPPSKSKAQSPRGSGIGGAPPVNPADSPADPSARAAADDEYAAAVDIDDAAEATVVGDADARWTAWYGGLDKGPMNSGCFQGPTTHECKNDGKYFPNRTST